MKNSSDWYITTQHFSSTQYLAGFKFNKGNTRTIYDICSKLAKETPEWHHWHRSSVLIINSEQFLQCQLGCLYTMEIQRPLYFTKIMTTSNFKIR